ncbi:uncharacterized protein LOC128996042 [Macrosteles quadrilineatus]|uniref:uncharacterized protein LOC128996042 n=1 Tax=Macrosteles quadrilineatus TaxID=74068 RepID=UPI0023E30A7E|nr:uncharacterized protein LOC128996042 [Macrosteles quadrilineatus]
MDQELLERLAQLESENANLQRQLQDLNGRQEQNHISVHPQEANLPDLPPVLPQHQPDHTAHSDERHEDHHIHRVSIKLPPFWKEKPRLWFAQVEAQFTLAHITSETTKYSYVISHLDERYANEVEDLIIDPPVETPYSTLKSEIIRRLSLSEEQRIRQLLMEEELGDKTPSQFLRHLRSLVGSTTIQDSLLKTIWMQRLPAHVQSILQVQISAQTDTLAITADKILAVQPNASFCHSLTSMPTSLNAVNSPNLKSSFSDDPKLTEVLSKLSALELQMKNMRKDVDSLRDRRPRSRQRSLSSSRYHAGSSSDTTEQTNLCWYHKRFGYQAEKCIPPCNFTSPTNSKGSQ